MAVTAFLDLHLRADAQDADARIAAILGDTRAFEGSLGIRVLRDVADAAHLVVVEQWRSLDDDDAYRAWRATPEGASDLGELVDRPPVLTRFETHSEL